MTYFFTEMEEFIKEHYGTSICSSGLDSPYCSPRDLVIAQWTKGAISKNPLPSINLKEADSITAWNEDLKKIQGNFILYILSFTSSSSTNSW
jgi:hypothetical protein